MWLKENIYVHQVIMLVINFKMEIEKFKVTNLTLAKEPW